MAVFNINRHVVEGSMYNNPNVIITWDDAIYVDDED